MTLLLLCILSIISIKSLSKLLHENEYNRQLSDAPQGVKIDFGAFFNRINQPLDNRQVDMTTEEMSKAYYTGNLCPLYRKVILKMMKNENIKVLIVGGSVTYGADLKNRLKQRWSNSFTEILNSGWYSGKFEVSNIGVGACNIDVWINRVREFTSTDLIIVDLSVNDQGFELKTLPLLYETFITLIDNLPNQPAIYFNYAFRGAKFDIVDIQGHCPDEYIKCCHGEMFCKRWYDMQDYVAQTLTKYQIPFVSYRDLVWPDYAHPPHELIHFWNGLSHPDGHAHALMAKLIAYGLMNQLIDSSKIRNTCHVAHNNTQYTTIPITTTTTTTTTGNNNNNNIVPLCLHPLTKMTATDMKESHNSFQLALPSSSLPLPLEYHHWVYQADSRNKYGWIVKMNPEDMKSYCSNQGSAQGNACNSTIQQAYDLPLLINVSATQPIIQLAYLKSYHEHMGSIKIWLDNDDNHSIIISGKWEFPYSVTRIVTISHTPLTHVNNYIKGDSYILPGLTEGKHVLHLAMFMNSCEHQQPSQSQQSQQQQQQEGGGICKWKLLSVVSC